MSGISSTVPAVAVESASVTPVGPPAVDANRTAGGGVPNPRIAVPIALASIVAGVSSLGWTVDRVNVLDGPAWVLLLLGGVAATVAGGATLLLTLGRWAPVVALTGGVATLWLTSMPAVWAPLAAIAAILCGVCAGVARLDSRGAVAVAAAAALAVVLAAGADPWLPPAADLTEPAGWVVLCLASLTRPLRSLTRFRAKGVGRAAAWIAAPLLVSAALGPIRQVAARAAWESHAADRQARDGLVLRLERARARSPDAPSLDPEWRDAAEAVEALGLRAVTDETDRVVLVVTTGWTSDLAYQRIRSGDSPPARERVGGIDVRRTPLGDGWWLVRTRWVLW